MAAKFLTQETLDRQNKRIREMRAKGMTNAAIGAVLRISGDAVAKRVAVMRRHGHTVAEGCRGPKSFPIIADAQLPAVVKALSACKDRLRSAARSASPTRRSRRRSAARRLPG